MSMTLQLLDQFGRPIQKEKRQQSVNFRAKYDAAQTTPENRRHWVNADGLAPGSANSPSIRKTLRERARYERDNDPHLNGLTKTLAYDLVGTGPRLQLQFDEADYGKGRDIEAAWSNWCRAVRLADKLRILHEARPIDGESFGLIITNPQLAHPVKMDFLPIECDRVCAPLNSEITNPNEDDGIVYDDVGNPVKYRILKQHPGDTLWGMGSDEATWFTADRVIHWFRASRPGQRRGVSELASCISIGAQTRRYAQAVLTAAEFAAMLAGVMKTNSQANTDDPVDIESLDEVEMVRGALLTLPEGWDASQFKAEQPTGTYKEFVEDKRGELGRPVNAPRNVITGNSSGYNYSSGRLDHIPYHRSVWIEREGMRLAVVDRIFLAWLVQATAVGFIDEGLQPFSLWKWDWHWDGFASLDPLKDANAIETRLRLGLTTLSEECAAEGKNWRDVIDQQAIERDYMKAKGLVPYGTPEPPAIAPSKPAAQPEEEVVDA